jgi:hypothetical protein
MREAWGVTVVSSADESPDPEEVCTPRLAVGMRVEGYFKLDADTAGDWYPGKIVLQNADGSWHVKYEDGDEQDYEGLKEDDLRLASGPWESWLDTYLPDLLISAYRAARRDPVQFDRSRLDRVHNPEKYCHCDDDAASCAGTPATAVTGKRKGP